MLSPYQGRNIAHRLSFLFICSTHLSFAPKFIFFDILSPYQGRHIAHRGSFFYFLKFRDFGYNLVDQNTFNFAPRFFWRHFNYHIYNETLRTDVQFSFSVAHLSFAPRFILSSVSVHRGGCSANVFSDERVRLVRRELSFAPMFIFGRFITI